MADAINTINPVPNTKFIVNKYEGIDGSRVNQSTPRGRLTFVDTNGRQTLPRTATEAALAVYPTDWAKPLNPPPYFDGPGLNGAPPYAFSDGSLDAQTGTFDLAYDQAFQTPWPVGYVQYDIPPMFYDQPVTSGNKCLVWDEGTFTYGSGNYVGAITTYKYGDKLYTAYASGSEGMVTNVAPSGVSNTIGIVVGREVFGTGTLTVKLKGTDAIL